MQMAKSVSLRLGKPDIRKVVRAQQWLESRVQAPREFNSPTFPKQLASLGCCFAIRALGWTDWFHEKL